MKKSKKKRATCSRINVRMDTVKLQSSSTDRYIINIRMNICKYLVNPLYIHLRINKIQQSIWHIMIKYKGKITCGK